MRFFKIDSDFLFKTSNLGINNCQNKILKINNPSITFSQSFMYNMGIFHYDSNELRLMTGSTPP